MQDFALMRMPLQFGTLLNVAVLSNHRVYFVVRLSSKSFKLMLWHTLPETKPVPIATWPVAPAVVMDVEQSRLLLYFPASSCDDEEYCIVL